MHVEMGVQYTNLIIVVSVRNNKKITQKNTPAQLHLFLTMAIIRNFVHTCKQKKIRDRVRLYSFQQHNVSLGLQKKNKKHSKLAALQYRNIIGYVFQWKPILSSNHRSYHCMVCGWLVFCNAQKIRLESGSEVTSRVTSRKCSSKYKKAESQIPIKLTSTYYLIIR